MQRTPSRNVLTVAAALAVCLGALLPGVLRLPAPAARAATSPAPGASAASSPFCQGLGKRYQASSGAWAFCTGPQQHGPAVNMHAAAENAGSLAGKPGNVDAASPAEDVTPSGLRAYGQSEVSVAASGQYVVEAWNDTTGLFPACPSPKAQSTGFGFSRDGGKTFTDLEGLPDAKCSFDISHPDKGGMYMGDPSVAAYQAGGHTYFYISSLFDNFFSRGRSEIALAACEVTGSGNSAGLRCSQPVIVGASSKCVISGNFKTCSFLDKDYVAIDPARGRLYDTFTEFGFTDAGTIEASVCDLGTPAGRAGPAGGTPAAPVCKHGTALRKTSKNRLGGKPYLTVQAPDPADCEYEGAYPAVNPASGNLFVGYEYNWSTSFGPILGSPQACLNKPIQNIVTKFPRHCLALRTVSPCSKPAARASVRITSMEAAAVPGYNRFPANDFPRLAVSNPAGTLSMVWNDARFHASGDVLLQSFDLKSLHPVQRAPVVLDTPHHGGLSFMPAVRTATAAGMLDVSWYSRNSATTTRTAVKAAIGVRPRTTSTPRSNITITNALSDWAHQTFDNTPNFGDYTDNALNVTSHKPYVGRTLYVAWTDGRTGVPQPFEAHLPAHN